MLKWAITDKFHEYLYGGQFDVYTDNNPLMYILTSAKFDAMGQRWVASLVNFLEYFIKQVKQMWKLMPLVASQDHNIRSLIQPQLRPS